MEEIEASDQKQSRKRKKREGPELSFENKYLAKLERYRNHMAKVRLNETPEQYKARLERARTHAAKMRQNETPEQRAARLERARVYKLESRRNETPEQRSKRLESARKQTLKYRQKETPEQREVRLERARVYNYQLRHNESPDQREMRLEYTRRYMAQMRKYKIFTGMINQADKDQWGALQALMTPTIKICNNADNSLLPQLHQIPNIHTDDKSTESVATDLESQQWSPILDDPLSTSTTNEIKTEEQLNNNNTITKNCDLNENLLSTKAEELPTESSDIFLFNSITSDIPPLQHEIEMVLKYKVLNQKQAEHPCPQCKKVYRYAHSLRKHLNVHHTVE